MTCSIIFCVSLTHSYTHTSRSGTNLEEWADGVLEIANVSHMIIMSGRINDGDEDIPVRQRDRERVFAWLKRVQNDVTCNIEFIKKEFVSNSKMYTHDGDTYYSKLKLGDDIISEGDFVKVKLKDTETVDGEDVDVRSVGVREYVFFDFSCPPLQHALRSQKCSNTNTNRYISLKSYACGKIFTKKCGSNIVGSTIPNRHVWDAFLAIIDTKLSRLIMWRRMLWM